MGCSYFAFKTNRSCMDILYSFWSSYKYRDSLYDGLADKGYHSIAWDATYHSSGVYFVKMSSEGYVGTQKIMLLK